MPAPSRASYLTRTHYHLSIPIHAPGKRFGNTGKNSGKATHLLLRLGHTTGHVSGRTIDCQVGRWTLATGSLADRHLPQVRCRPPIIAPATPPARKSAITSTICSRHQYQPNPEELRHHPTRSESQNRNRGKNGNISGNAVPLVTLTAPTRRSRQSLKLSPVTPSHHPRQYPRQEFRQTFRQKNGKHSGNHSVLIPTAATRYAPLFPPLANHSLRKNENRGKNGKKIGNHSGHISGHKFGHTSGHTLHHPLRTSQKRENAQYVIKYERNDTERCPLIYY
ncbi:MAG: hypothetical protein ACXVCO_01655 [Ktedonobacterales bacterium]